MKLYRFRGYGWGAESWIVAPTFYDACKTAEAEGNKWREVELLASDDDKTWPAGTPKKRLIVRVPPAAPDKDARIADLERKLAELTVQKVLESVTALANRVKEGLVIRQDFDTAAKIRDQVSVARNSFGDLLEIIEDAANVLDAQRVEKEEAKP